MIFKMDLLVNNFTKQRGLSSSFFKTIINKAANEVGLDKNRFGLSLNLVGVAKIKSLNRSYRQKNQVTDVLAFPLTDLSRKQWLGSSESKPANAILELGDIFICLPTALRQAKQQGEKLGLVLANLLTHGFLHLLGYDHERSKQEGKKMFELQNRILSKLNS